MHITLENIYMHLFLSLCMVICCYMLVYTQISTYIDAFWLAFGPILHQGTWGSERDPQRMQHKCLQSRKPGSHAKTITQQGIISKIKASVAIPILKEELERFSAQLWTSTVLYYHSIL